MAKDSRTIVGQPLTPTLLGKLGAIEAFPAIAADFTPDGAWSHTYRIWTCHGYREDGNDDVGYLRITRRLGRGDHDFSLDVRQAVVEADAQTSTIDATMVCETDRTAKPLTWRITSHFTGPDGSAMDSLATRQTGRIEGQQVVIETAGREIRRDVSDVMATDWGLFEAVQRLAFEDTARIRFQLLEGLSLVKGAQTLSYSGSESVDIGGGNITMHRFDQIGPGVLPIEYWLDERHRVLMVTSLNKAYVLDDAAEGKIKEQITGSREAYRKKQTP